jgi:hypothetical protein
MKKVLGPHVLALMLASTLAPFAAHAHGEDKLGPHGGVIRMPGALHTEVVAMGPQKIAVYLLDMHFEEPTVDDSSVKGAFVHGGKQHELSCQAEERRFVCKLPPDASIERGELRIMAMRKGVKGGAAVYPLPLRVEKAN